jgi:hypothetical protein
VGRGNRAKRGEPGRPPHVGFQPGHRPFYTGGSVPGHAPTNPAGHMPPEHYERLHGPNGVLKQYQFGQPLGNEHSKKGGNRPKDKERNCLEEIQNGQERDEILQRRYPPRMIKRLKALLDVSEAKGHRDFMHAQRQVREILTRNRGDPSERAADGQKDTIEVWHGRVDAQMPGALQKEEGGPSAPVAEGPPSKAG